jgi:predicted small secreted protein
MRTLSRLVLLAGALLLGGCAAMRSVSSDVSSYGDWPAERQPGAYAFERLPSQQARPAESDALEGAARGALEQAGFKPVDAGKEPDVLVQVEVREARTDLSPWDDPLWWRGGFGYWRGGPWVSPRWSLGMRYDFPRYERQVALLIRDRASGKPLFEARASSEGSSRLDDAVLAAMFQAAMMDFPRLGMNPRRVVVELPH